MLARREVYVSTDVESDGPIPGAYSMLSLGSVAFDDTGRELESFSANLRRLGDARQHEETMREFWSKNPEAWAAATRDAQDPGVVMLRYDAWLRDLPGRAVFVGYPASFDFGFVHWYLEHFVGRSAFGFSALDMKTLAMAAMGVPFCKATKSNMPKWWFQDCGPHTHVAVEDAREQGRLFFKILSALRTKGGA